jgi:hypothetical protein
VIRIYRECGLGALRCKAEWEVTSPENLRSAILAVKHAPFLQPPMGPLVIEIDDELYYLEQLPKARDSKNLLDRCGHWLYGVARVRIEAERDRPSFGL